MFNKRTENWFPVKVKTGKEYAYIPDLMKNIVERRIEADPSVFLRRKDLSEDHPRRIAPNLGSKPAPPTAELVEKHKSRLSGNVTSTDDDRSVKEINEIN